MPRLTSICPVNPAYLSKSALLFGVGFGLVIYVMARKAARAKKQQRSQARRQLESVI